MRAVALRLEGPIQSWGGPVAGDDRPSFDVPTRSGVMGLVAGALGIGREEVERLAALHAAFHFAVRVDRRGSVGVDYHTTLAVPAADGKPRKDAVISKRRYLYDASFTALLIEKAGDEPAQPSLNSVGAALARPAFAPFLGRRACPPSVPVRIGVVEGDGWHALFDHVPAARRADEGQREVHLDRALAGEPAANRRAHRRRDVLVGRLPRLFGEREVVVAYWTPKEAAPGPRPAATIDPWL